MGICGSKKAHDPHASCPKAPLTVKGSLAPSDANRRQLSLSGSWASESDCSDEEQRPSRLADVATESSRRRRSLIRNKWADITDFYELDKALLGKGAYGDVCKATCKQTGVVRAVKCLSKARARETRKRYRQEVEIMKMFDHPNIIRLFETYEDKKWIFLVLELCTGGDLLEYLVDNGGRLDEQRSAVVMDQILRPVLYMHQKRGVCHRDIKPENFLFLSRETPLELNTLKVIDFGFACTMAKDEAMTTRLGTASYLSPQVLAGQYDESCDLWSCGVIMYVMLSGQYPFQGKCDVEVMQSVRKGNYAFQGAGWESASEGAKDLIRHLLKYDPRDRYNAEQALRHEWIRQRVPSLTGAAPLPPSLLLDLRCFCAQSRFRRGALVLVAQHLGEDDTRSLRNAFTALDSRGCGVLNVEELQGSLLQKDVQDEYPELVEVMDELVAGNGDGFIGYSDFLAASLESRHLKQEAACRAAFRAFDRNGDGRITLEELTEVLLGGGRSPSNRNRELQAASLEQTRAMSTLLKQADTNGDGVIDFQEFMVMLRGDMPKSTSSSL